jgi:hypothetical protein
MALALLNPGATVKEFELHVFELAYVMSLMGVDSVAGLPSSVIFPQDAKIRKKVLEEGQRRLVANGWLTPVEGKGQYDNDLLSMCAAVADPRFSILTRRGNAQGERFDATIYFNNVEAVEVVQTDKQEFRLRRSRDAAAAFQQVRKMVGIPPRPKFAGVMIELRVESFDSVRRHAAKQESFEAVSELMESGMALDAAEDLLRALSTPLHKGIVSILKHTSQKVTDVRVLGFYVGDSGAWITSVASDAAQRVRIEAVNAEEFLERLVDRVGSVCTPAGGIA